jgi:hypothetical protein
MRKSEDEKVFLYRARVAGIQKLLAKLPTLMLDGTAYTPAALAALYSAWLTKAEESNAAHARWISAVKQRDANEASLLPLDAAFKRFLLAYYGPKSATLVQYGVSAPKVGKKTVDVKAAAAEKAKATRAARGTMGKKQRKAAAKTKAPADTTRT